MICHCETSRSAWAVAIGVSKSVKFCDVVGPFCGDLNSWRPPGNTASKISWAYLQKITPYRTHIYHAEIAFELHIFYS